MNDPRTNQEQFENWNGASGERWVATADQRDAVLEPIGDLVLERVAVQPGETVLDIGCGCGATTLAAATVAGPEGYVVGLDLSAPMLDFARHRVDATGARHLRFEQGDAQTHRLGERFDVAISRFGTMFFAEPAAAFANIAAHLRPGGRLCLATWQPMVANAWLTIPGAALLDYAALPESDPDDSADMFSQADPAAITNALNEAAFADIAITGHSVRLRFGANVDEAVDFLDSSGPGRAVLDSIADQDLPAALTAVADALAPHHHPDQGVLLDAAVWITHATVGPLGHRPPPDLPSR